MDTRELHWTFYYYKAKADPNEGVTKDTFRIWRERNPNERPNLTANALMNQRRYIEKQHKLTEIELDNIKQQIKNELNEQNNQTDSKSQWIPPTNWLIWLFNQIEISHWRKLKKKASTKT